MTTGKKLGWIGDICIVETAEAMQHRFCDCGTVLGKYSVKLCYYVAGMTTFDLMCHECAADAAHRFNLAAVTIRHAIREDAEKTDTEKATP